MTTRLARLQNREPEEVREPSKSDVGLCEALVVHRPWL